MVLTKWKALILVGIALGLYGWGYHNANVAGELKLQQHLTQDAQDAQQFEELQRKREQAFAGVREAQEADYQRRLDDLARRSDDLAASADGMRNALAASDAKMRRLAADAGVNAGAAKAALVLSKLLGEATDELQRVAGTADSWRMTAESCQAFYDKIRGQ